MANSVAMLIVAASVTIAVIGLIYGVTGESERRRAIGLSILQSGMGAAGLTLIGAGIFFAPPDTISFGLLLLVLGTGVTAIGRSRPGN